MTISSRTPEGIPHHCPVCGKVASVEPSYPADDACCPSCGHLLSWFRDRVRHAGDPVEITLSSSFVDDLGAESLDMIELVMELEEEFGVTIPEDAADHLQTVRDAIRYIQQHRRK